MGELKTVSSISDLHPSNVSQLHNYCQRVTEKKKYNRTDNSWFSKTASFEVSEQNVSVTVNTA